MNMIWIDRCRHRNVLATGLIHACACHQSLNSFTTQTILCTENSARCFLHANERNVLIFLSFYTRSRWVFSLLHSSRIGAFSVAFDTAANSYLQLISFANANSSRVRRKRLLRPREPMLTTVNVNIFSFRCDARFAWEGDISSFCILSFAYALTFIF